jgi:extracellular elastinolytic metalloproteinase
MGREIDSRNFSVDKTEDQEARQSELENIAAEISNSVLPGNHQIRIESFDAATGNPAVIASEAAPAEEGNYVQRALDHVQFISSALGLEPSQPTEFAPDPNVQETSSGAKSVHLQQQYKGIPIFQAAQTVRFAPNDRLTETVGSSVTFAQERAVSPRLSVEEAVLKAAQFVATPDPDEREATDQFGEPLNPVSVEVTGFVPKVVAAFTDKAEQPTVLESGPFGDRIVASLIWFVPNEDEPRLAWEVVLTMPNYEGQYRTMIDAETGEVLYSHQLVQHIEARGNVYRVDGSESRQMRDFPENLNDYGLPIPPSPPLPQSFPDQWVEADETTGNSVRARLGDVGPTMKGKVQDGVHVFDPADTNGAQQQILNIFYFNCWLHDYFYLLGFREVDGNFQRDNLGRGGLPSDRVDARAHPGPVNGTANMLTLADGTAPIMNMGLVSRTGRHTAFDFDVVTHEFMHGVTNRLVGGPHDSRSLEAPQSSGMGEGWGDYIACTVTGHTVVGAWVVGQAGGIRDFPYDNFPDDFGDLGTGRYTGFLPDGRRHPHPIGEIWCATLMEMNRNIGAEMGVQLVVDALKLSPTNPSFLEMRDSILAALDAMLASDKLSSDEHSTVRNGIWEAFAKFGMGPSAQSNGSSLSGIVADFNTP